MSAVNLFRVETPAAAKTGRESSCGAATGRGFICFGSDMSATVDTLLFSASKFAPQIEVPANDELSVRACSKKRESYLACKISPILPFFSLVPRSRHHACSTAIKG